MFSRNLFLFHFLCFYFWKWKEKNDSNSNESHFENLHRKKMSFQLNGVIKIVIAVISFIQLAFIGVNGMRFFLAVSMWKPIQSAKYWFSNVVITCENYLSA